MFEIAFITYQSDNFYLQKLSNYFHYKDISIMKMVKPPKVSIAIVYNKFPKMKFQMLNAINYIIFTKKYEFQGHMLPSSWVKMYGKIALK